MWRTLKERALGAIQIIQMWAPATHRNTATGSRRRPRRLGSATVIGMMGLRPSCARAALLPPGGPRARVAGERQPARRRGRPGASGAPGRALRGRTSGAGGSARAPDPRRRPGRRRPAPQERRPHLARQLEPLEGRVALRRRRLGGPHREAPLGVEERQSASYPIATSPFPPRPNRRAGCQAVSSAIR